MHDKTKAALLKHLRRFGNVSKACKAAKIHRTRFYGYMLEPSFNQAVNEAKAEFLTNKK